MHTGAYTELKRRARACFALAILRGTLRMPRYRAWLVINTRLFTATGR